MKRRIISAVLAVCLILVGFVSCKKEEEKASDKHVYESVVDGKLFSISYCAEKGEGEERVKYTDEEFSNIDKGAEKALVDKLSFLSAEYNGNINVISGYADYVFDANAEVVKLMKELYALSDATMGKYKPVISAVKEYKCSNIIEISENKLIKHDKSAKVDLYGVAESYALSFAVESVKKSGVKEAILKYGNTVAKLDTKAEKTPTEAAVYYADGNMEADATVKLSGGCISTVTKNEKLTDVITGKDVSPSHNTVVVLSDDYFVASCLARTFMEMNAKDIAELHKNGAYKFEYIIVENDMSVVKSSGIGDNVSFGADSADQSE